MVVEPGFLQVRAGEWLAVESRRNAHFDLSIGLGSELSRHITVWPNARPRPFPVLKIIQIPDAAAQVGAHLSHAEG